MTNEYLQHLTELRNKAWHAAKEIMDRAVEEKRELSAEEQVMLDKTNADIDGYDVQIRDGMQRLQNEREADVARAAFEPVLHTSVTVSPQEMSAIEMFFRGQGPGLHNGGFDVDLRAAARERQLIRNGADERELRALLTDTGSSGSLVPTEFARQLYQYMEASSAVRQLAYVFTTTNGDNMDFPTVATHGIGTQVSGQGTALAGTDPVFGKLTLGAFKYGQLVQISNEAVSDAAIDILGFVASNIGRALGRVTDTAYATGSGSGKPNGVMTACTGSIATGGSLITGTLNDYIDLQYSVVQEYRQNGAFLVNDITAGTLRKIREDGGTNGQYLWQPAIIAGQPDKFLGSPIYTDVNIATHGSNARVAAFGDFSAYYIRDAGSARFERSDDYAFNTDLVSFRGVVRTDSDLIDVNAVKVLRQNV